MTIKNINIEELVERVKSQVASEKDLSPSFKASLKLLLVVVTLPGSWQQEQQHTALCRSEP